MRRSKSFLPITLSISLISSRQVQGVGAVKVIGICSSRRTAEGLGPRAAILTPRSAAKNASRSYSAWMGCDGQRIPAPLRNTNYKFAPHQRSSEFKSFMIGRHERNFPHRWATVGSPPYVRISFAIFVGASCFRVQGHAIHESSLVASFILACLDRNKQKFTGAIASWR